MANNELGNVKHRDSIYAEGAQRIGVIRNAAASDIRRIISEASEKDRSFEENFAVEPVAANSITFAPDICRAPARSARSRK